MDGKLDFEEIDEKYCISFVFKGDWKAKLEGPGSALYPSAASNAISLTYCPFQVDTLLVRQCFVARRWVSDEGA